MGGMTRVRPPALRPGDTIGIVAPASAIKKDALLAGCETLTRMGYKPVYEDSIVKHDLYFAGTTERRLQELHSMFQRDDVRAILCARGGYGSNGDSVTPQRLAPLRLDSLSRDAGVTK